MLYHYQIDPAIERALREDVTHADLATEAVFQTHQWAQVDLIAKDTGILCGWSVFQRVFELLQPEVEFHTDYQEGDRLEPGQYVATIQGHVGTLLTAERVALNYLGRMSGIASATDRLVRVLGDPTIQVVDTRKTTPGLRLFEKYAVRIGGGGNHRYNLSDCAMLKDNHIDAAGSITRAVRLTRERVSFTTKIEVECESIAMVKEALEADADIIMLDNMPIETVREAVELIGNQAVIEASGNITEQNIARYRGSGVDIISSGAITHSAPNFDYSMKHLRYLDS